MKAASSTAAGSALAAGSAIGKGQRDAGVEQEVERDVEKRAAVGGPRQARQRTVEPVAQAAGQHQREARRVRLAGDGRRGADTHRKAQPGDVVGMHGPRRAAGGRRAPGRPQPMASACDRACRSRARSTRRRRCSEDGWRGIASAALCPPPMRDRFKQRAARAQAEPPGVDRDSGRAPTTPGRSASCPRRCAAAAPPRPRSPRLNTATTLSTNRPIAAMRPPNPSTSRIGNTSSAPVPSHAASSGGSSGTWYSSVNNASVVSQSRTLVSPDSRNTLATYRRAASCATGCSASSARSARSA